MPTVSLPSVSCYPLACGHWEQRKRPRTCSSMRSETTRGGAPGVRTLSIFYGLSSCEQVRYRVESVGKNIPPKFQDPDYFCPMTVRFHKFHMSTGPLHNQCVLLLRYSNKSTPHLNYISSCMMRASVIASTSHKNRGVAVLSALSRFLFVKWIANQWLFGFTGSP